MSRFITILVVSPLEDGKTWALMQELRYVYGNEPEAQRSIVVSTGFLTDFASVPWFVQWVIPKWGKYGNPAVIHDWLYWTQVTTRKEADDIFLDAMNVTGVGCLRKYAIYFAVRFCGCWAWLRNEEDRISGGDRVMLHVDLERRAKSLRKGSLRQVFRALKRRFHRDG